MNKLSAFGVIATKYDKQFTTRPIASLMRQAVMARADAVFPRGCRVLEMNCGTGEDAIHLGGRGVRVLATDASPEMVGVARSKIAARGLSDLVKTERLAWEDLKNIPDASFDGLLSNFGGLNCVREIEPLVEPLGRLVSPGGTVLLCVMGPLAIWEWFWFLLRLQPSKALRRLRANPEWHGIALNYPRPSMLVRAFASDFRLKRISGIGFLLPPCISDTFAERWPRLIRRLDRWERRLETVPPLPQLADHYLVEMERL